jgi:hypothetical protein
MSKPAIDLLARATERNEPLWAIAAGLYALADATRDAAHRRNQPVQDVADSNEDIAKGVEKVADALADEGGLDH